MAVTPDTTDPDRARSRCVPAGAWNSCAASGRPGLPSEQPWMETSVSSPGKEPGHSTDGEC